MKLQLLGTGSSDGWPNPWCSCASCYAARSTGELRGQTGVLVDDRLLIDCGPDVPRAAARFGIDLGTVELLLIGHAHPDHCGPQALMWRGWSSQAQRPLEVIGPPAVIAACRPWVDPAGPISFTVIEPGRELTRGGYRIQAHPARHGGPEIGPAVLFDVTAPDGGRLLYAVDTAPFAGGSLPGDRSHPYDVLLLEETFGDGGGQRGDHHGLDDFAATVERHAPRGNAWPTSSQVVAVHLGHGNPAGDELHRRLALVGAVAPPGRRGAAQRGRCRAPQARAAPRAGHRGRPVR